MTDYELPTPEGKDPELWELAKKRAAFKSHAIWYLVINIFLWIVWYFTAFGKTEAVWDSYPWPIWTTVFWGMGLAFHFLGAYVFTQSNAVEKEYEKLKQKQKK